MNFFNENSSRAQGEVLPFEEQMVNKNLFALKHFVHNFKARYAHKTLAIAYRIEDIMPSQNGISLHLNSIVFCFRSEIVCFFNLCTCSVNLIEGAAPGHMYANIRNAMNRALSVERALCVCVSARSSAPCNRRRRHKSNILTS